MEEPKELYQHVVENPVFIPKKKTRAPYWTPANVHESQILSLRVKILLPIVSWESEVGVPRAGTRPWRTA